MADQYRVVSFQNDRNTSTWPPSAQETYGNNTPLYPGYNPVGHSISSTLISFFFFFPFLSFLSLTYPPSFLPFFLSSPLAYTHQLNPRHV